MRDTSLRTAITERTIRLVKRILYPWEAEGILSKNEYDEIIINLKSLSQRGTLFPIIVPKLINQKEAAEMLGLGLSNFKKLEKEGTFPFKRKMLGCSVRYRNLDIVKYILADSEKDINDEYDFSTGIKNTYT